MLLSFVTLCAIPAFVMSQPVTVGSSIKLRSLGSANDKFYLSSIDVQWTGRPGGQNIVTTVDDESKPEIYWTLAAAAGEPTKPSGQELTCGSTVRLLHAVSGKLLHADGDNRSSLAKQTEVFSAGEARNIDTNDNFLVECDSGVWNAGTVVTFQHLNTKGYLASHQGLTYTNQNCPRCPMVGQREVMITPHRAVPHAHWAVEGGVSVREFKEVVDEGSDDSESARGEEL